MKCTTQKYNYHIRPIKQVITNVLYDSGAIFTIRLRAANLMYSTAKTLELVAKSNSKPSLYK